MTRKISIRYEPLSTSRISAAKPQEHDIWLADSNGSRGAGRLLLRITPKNIRRFYFRYSSGPSRHTISLGLYSRIKCTGFLTLSEARGIARKLAGTLLPSPFFAKEQGASVADKAPERQPFQRPISTGIPARQPIESAGKPAGTAAAGSTLLALCNAYADRLERHGKISAGENRNLIKNHIATSEIAKAPASTLDSTQLTSLLRKIVQMGKVRTARKVRGILHAAYENALLAQFDPSAVDEDIDTTITSNPVKAISSLADQNKTRKRVLNKAELSQVWQQIQISQADSTDVALRALRLSVLLAGQRCQQLLRVKVSDINLDAGTICIKDGKGKRTVARDHVLPLSGNALPEVKWLLNHARNVGSTYLFPSSVRGKVVTQGTISAIIKNICDKMRESDINIAHFQFSDLRRTAETTLASMGVSKDYRAQLQSHGISSVQARHYDMYDYLKEKEAAILLWQKHLESLLPVH